MMERILFTKSLCSACQEVKEQFDLESLNIEIQELGPDNPRALAHLAWYELVETMETKGLPILVIGGQQILYGKDEIESYLKTSDRKLIKEKSNNVYDTIPCMGAPWQR